MAAFLRPQPWCMCDYGSQAARDVAREMSVHTAHIHTARSHTLTKHVFVPPWWVLGPRRRHVTEDCMVVNIACDGTWMVEVVRARCTYTATLVPFPFRLSVHRPDHSDMG